MIRRLLTGLLALALATAASAQPYRPGFGFSRPGFQFLSAGAAAGLRPQDVFATSLIAGNGGTQAITNGLDLAGKGGAVWLKGRSPAGIVAGISDTVRGRSVFLVPDSTGSEITSDPNTDLQSFDASGFTLGTPFQSNFNVSGRSGVAWSFRRAAKFFDVGTLTHTAGTANNIDLSTLATIGQVTIKRRDAAGDWAVWHRSLTTGNNLVLNSTAAQSTTNAFISVSGTTATFSASAPAGTYTYEALAHDPDTTNGIIQCGSYTEGTAPVQVTLGWQPQFLIVKAISGATSDWYIVDAARGFTSTSNALLSANTTAAEGAGGGFWTPSATGFSAKNGVLGSGVVATYCVIRAPT